ncbi:uncharacterized protein LOC105382530 isoform X3 [Plutella xylostella]|uniref:uncharacterized protein LOC105382530 isoform X3 n=1 Tax=Plutella xylostella TaxID=51655 RepID=UPI0020325934|nr:uncharacterized protein LOC105382530 isoform X3 [Plutella xylostella]
MTDCNDLRALSKITAEVDESQVKIILSSHCIKAQLFLVDRLRKETERQKQICKYISGGNIKLEAEIKHAEQEFRSLLTANETIKSSNIEIRKDLLLAREKKVEVLKRVQFGEKKYEDLWIQCKNRYESIPFVQKWFEITEKNKEFQERIKFLTQEVQTLTKEVRTRKESIKEMDKKHLIQMVQYLVSERPKIINAIKEEMAKVKGLNAEIQDYLKEQDVRSYKEEIRPGFKSGDKFQKDNMMVLDTDWPSLCDNFSKDQDRLRMPRLQLASGDMDLLTVNLEQFQIKKNSVAQVKRTDSNSMTLHGVPSVRPEEKKDAYYSSFFNKSYLDENEAGTSDTRSYANKKLINILDDINIDRNDAKKIVSGVNPNALKIVNIGSCISKTGDGVVAKNSQTESTNPEPMEQEEELVVASGSTNILMPPSQFLDMTQGSSSVVVEELMDQEENRKETEMPRLKNSQEKKVSFGLPVIEEVPEESAPEPEAAEDCDVTVSSQLDVSTASHENDSFSRMKDRILKKYSLDLSPDFVYEKKTSDKIVTSKFFNKTKETDRKAEVDTPKEADKQNAVEVINTQCEQTARDEINKGDADLDYIGNNATGDINNTKKEDKSITGFLFTHGPNGIPDSLDVSMSTTGFDDGDADFPHGIDSSLLLSPKADVPMQISGDNAEVFSQEVPNFLSGLRKTGLSFFGKSSGSEPKADAGLNQQGNNFNFTFGGESSKSRGGLFSMFQ